MPRVPNFSPGIKLNYIVNYVIAGCEFPRYFLAEFAEDPGFDLLFLFLFPDIDDVVQSVIQPGSKRGKKRGRHGRGGRPGVGIPDVSDIIGARARAVANPYDALRLTPIRYAFPLLNIVEGVSFTFAIIDKSADFAFAQLYGMATVDPGHCITYPRVMAESVTEETQSGPIPTLQAINAPHEIFNQGFFYESSAARCNEGRWYCNVKMRFRSAPFNGTSHTRVALGTSPTVITAQSELGEATETESDTIEVSGNVDPGQLIHWGTIDRDAAIIIEKVEVLGMLDHIPF